jgi:hypothetical protein
MRAVQDGATLGERFATAFAAKDFEQVRALLPLKFK